MKNWKICALLAALAFVVGAAFFTRGCTTPAPIVCPASSPSPEMKAESKTTSTATSAGTQKTKLTAWFPLSQISQKPASQEGQEAPLQRLPGTSGPAEIAPPGWGRLDIELEQDFSTSATSSGEASASIAPSNEVKKQEVTPIGVIVSTAPGAIALDYRALHLGQVGVDVEANHRQVGVGLSLGTKVFGTGGVYQGFDGGRGCFVGVGVRI